MSKGPNCSFSKPDYLTVHDYPCRSPGLPEVMHSDVSGRVDNF